MTAPTLESFVQNINYADIPETWQVPGIGHFSAEKTLHDYQADALQKAARVLFMYYKNEHEKESDELPAVNSKRKRDFAQLYGNLDIPDPRKYETLADKKNQRENQVFRILSDFIAPQGDRIPYHNLINRMCFWMATGSGKTLVMVKLIEYLHSLKRHGEIPPHHILILAPSEHLLGQIRRTVDEFNRSGGLHIDLIPLRQAGRGPYQHRLGNSAVVYYHRSDNISDVQKDALTDYRTYENGGKWYILLDEAHKGGKEDSKRQAYYAVMAREGFLFNFSATFTDKEDIVTTVKKYNLDEFVTNGHGKNIYLNETEYNAFRGQEISGEEKRKIVLKSLITLTYVSMRVDELREETGIQTLYHRPLMLTLVNSVNTDIHDGNDLWAFFQTLLAIASGSIQDTHFEKIKKELLDEWCSAQLLFGGDGSAIIGIDEDAVTKIKITDLREAIFCSRRKGALQYIRSTDNKELAFQMKNADAPFALIRIGDTAKWRKELLHGYEETTALREKSFFDELEQSRITILMGSRSFFESWDSNRPNVINFINIGGLDARKFVVQSIGRGVRIEPLKDKRRRLSHLLCTLKGKEHAALNACHNRVAPPETLFLFATNRHAVQTVLEGVKGEQASAFVSLKGFETAQLPIDGTAMPLLVPKYKATDERHARRAKFAMSKETRERLKGWFAQTSKSVLVVRDGLTVSQVDLLRSATEGTDAIQITPQKNYAMLAFLQDCFVSHLSKKGKAIDRIREIDDEKDIVHFRQIRVHQDYVTELQEKVYQVRRGGASDEEIPKLAEQLRRKKITRKEYDDLSSGRDEEAYKDLKIKRLAQHYYLPVILGEGTVNYIQHIIKVESEVLFVQALEDWLGENKVEWDEWMFSKLDESLDAIHIPYYDRTRNAYRHFLPDFVFWMRKGNEYRIVFVDPKTDVYTAAEHKIDGYRELFECEDGKPLKRTFLYRNRWKVSVDLLMFRPNANPSQAYARHWTGNPGKIFEPAKHP